MNSANYILLTFNANNGIVMLGKVHLMKEKFKKFIVSPWSAAVLAVLYYVIPTLLSDIRIEEWDNHYWIESSSPRTIAATLICTAAVAFVCLACGIKKNWKYFITFIVLTTGFKAAIILIININYSGFNYPNGTMLDYLANAVFTPFYCFGDLIDIFFIGVHECIAVVTFLIGLIAQAIKKREKQTI